MNKNKSDGFPWFSIIVFMIILSNLAVNYRFGQIVSCKCAAPCCNATAEAR